MLNRSRAFRGLAPAILVLAAACSDRNPVAPAPVVPEPPAPLMLVQCRVNVAEGEMTCEPHSPLGGARPLIMGGQDVYVKLASSGTAYNSGAQILSSSVTVQNLLRQALGTPDGSTVAGVKVFFHSGPVVTSGTGTAEVANADGTETFTSGTQPYFMYGQILSPYQVSAAKTWQFNVSPTVGFFSFTLLVSAPMADEAGALLDLVWDGDTSTDWQTAANWSGDAVPGTSSVVSVPPDSLLVSTNMPVLSANGQAMHVRVGFGSTLGLAGHTLEVGGNVDAPGAISGGTVRMTGAGALLRGTVGALNVTGSSFLQGSTRATGAVSVTGTLTTNGNPLSIAVP